MSPGVIVLSATILAGASALVPSRVDASPPAHSAARSTVQTIPAGLARAIHARIGPGPIGLGSAPRVSGITPTGRGWSVKDPTWASSSVPAASLVSSAGKRATHFGYSVAISADDTTALVGASGSNVAGPGAGAVFVYRAAPAHHWSTTSQPSATITPSGVSATAGDLQFGYSVALSADGTTALIGSPSESSSGNRAYVYHVASETRWESTVTPTATIYDPSGIDDGFGDSVALSSTGTTAFIGAPDAGEAYIFRASSETSWASTATPTAILSNGAKQNDSFGYSVALSTTGTTALIASRYADAYVFRVASLSHWASTSKPTATLSNGAGALGCYSVALSGDGTTALVGAPSVFLSTAVGAAYVFQASAGNVWSPSPSPVATLTNGVDVVQNFGSSVAFSANGKTALVGASGINTDTGAAYIFTAPSERSWSSSATPSPKATLTHGGGAPNDGFGSSLTLSPDGTTAFIDTGSTSIAGADYVYHSSGSGWSSSTTPVATMTVAGNPDQGDIGYSVALSADGTTALVGYGSPYSDAVDNYVNDVYVFHSSSEGTWSSSAASVATLTNGVAGDMEYGTSVALSADGTTAFVGDIGLNGNSGAVYVYRVPSESAWSSKARLVATLTDAAAPGESFGWGIALSSDGSTALIGNGLFGSETDSCQLAVVGEAYVFHVSSESAWSSSSKPTATLGDGGSVGDCFGSAVALSANGTTALIGAYGAGRQAGAAYVFHASSERAWSSSSKPKATLTDSSAAWFGWSLNLSADGSTALIGAPSLFRLHLCLYRRRLRLPCIFRERLVVELEARSHAHRCRTQLLHGLRLVCRAGGEWHDGIDRGQRRRLRRLSRRRLRLQCPLGERLVVELEAGVHAVQQRLSVWEFRLGPCPLAGRHDGAHRRLRQWRRLHLPQHSPHRHYPQRRRHDDGVADLGGSRFDHEHAHLYLPRLRRRNQRRNRRGGHSNQLDASLYPGPRYRRSIRRLHSLDLWLRDHRRLGEAMEMATSSK